MLSIDLESSTFRPGQAIRGVVRVAARRAVDCRSLSVRLAWSLRSGGELRRGAVQLLSLGHGRWPPGERLFDFALEAPGGPPTEVSSLVEFSWRIEASAELSFGRVRRAATPITIAKGDAGVSVTVDELVPLEPEGLALSLVGVLLVWGATALVTAIVVADALDEETTFNGLALVAVLFVIIAGVKSTVDVVRRPLAERALGFVSLRRRSGGLGRGPIALAVEVRPRRSVAVGPVMARIVARSVQVDSDGRTRIRVDYSGVPVRFGGGPVKRGEVITWEAELPVEPGLWARSDGKWTVDAWMPIPRSPDWVGAVALPLIDT